MASHSTEEREKVTSKIPEALRMQLKVRAAQHGVDIQDAVAAGLEEWRTVTIRQPTMDTSGAVPFSTWLRVGVYDDFKELCAARGVSYTQGLAQAVSLWLANHPFPGEEPGVRPPQRKIVANQKGGVGKTALTAGVGQAYAEEVGAETDAAVGGRRVLLVDFDPQGHLSNQLGIPTLPLEGDSLVKHMTAEGKGHIRELVAVVKDARFGDRLHVLPACADGFVLDVKLSTIRAREAALERALEPLEEDYDVILVDCPPSLGLAMDCAIYYGRRRDGETPGRSGVVIPVQAEDSSADAFTLLTGQIEDLREDMRIDIDYLGLVVNMYDSRRGFIATSSLDNWKAIGDPPVVAIVPDRKEQREAVRQKQGLLAYDPKCDQSQAMREIAKELA
jgi:chromosome partitioning protein